jgi:hypothetical protein
VGFDPSLPAEEVAPLTGGFDPSKPSEPVESTDILTPRGKSIASAIYTPTLKYGGAMTAGVLGLPEAAATGPMAPVTEAAAGATGYAIGGELADKLDQLIGVAKPPSSVKDITGRTVENVKEGVTNELIARPVGAALGTLWGMADTGAHASAEKIGELVTKAKNMGIDLSPSELVGTKSMAAVESILDHLPWTSSIMQRFRLGQLQQLSSMRDELIAKAGSSNDIEEMGLQIKSMADNFMQKVGTVNKSAMDAMKNRLLQKVGSKSTYTSLDESAQQAVQTYQQELAEQTSAAYKAVADKAPKDQIVPNNTIAVARKIMQEQERVVPSARNNDLYDASRTLSMSHEDIPETILQQYNDPNLPPRDKQALAQQYPELNNPELGKTYEDLAANVKAFNIKKYAQVTDAHGAYQITNAGRQWDDLIGGLHDDMDGIVSSSGNNDLIKSHQIARDLYLKKMALFEDPAFKMINDKSPGAVATTILQSGNANLIQRYRALTGEDLFGKAKDRLTNDVLGLGEQDTVNGDDIRARLLKLGDGINSVYSPDELNYFKKLAKAVDLREGATNELLTNPLLKKMVSPSAELVPSGIAKSLVTPQNSGNALAIENMLGKGAKEKVANAFLPQLLSQGQNGDFLPQTFAKQFSVYGRKTLESWYGKELTDQLADLADVSGKMSGVQKLGQGTSGYTYLIGFYEGQRLLRESVHAVAGGFSSHAVLSLGMDGTMILGSRQLAKLYTAPMGRNIFIQGLTTPAGSNAAKLLGGRIAGILGNELMKSGEQQ